MIQRLSNQPRGVVQDVFHTKFVRHIVQKLSNTTRVKIFNNLFFTKFLLMTSKVSSRNSVEILTGASIFEVKSYIWI